MSRRGGSGAWLMLLQSERRRVSSAEPSSRPRRFPVPTGNVWRCVQTLKRPRKTLRVTWAALENSTDLGVGPVAHLHEDSAHCTSHGTLSRRRPTPPTRPAVSRFFLFRAAATRLHVPRIPTRWRTLHKVSSGQVVKRHKRKGGRTTKQVLSAHDFLFLYFLLCFIFPSCLLLKCYFNCFKSIRTPREHVAFTSLGGEMS